jgi:hypothetical protein
MHIKVHILHRKLYVPALNKSGCVRLAPVLALSGSINYGNGTTSVSLHADGVLGQQLPLYLDSGMRNLVQFNDHW